jgi:hypothetical protein
MSESTSETLSRRKALAFFGLAAVLGLAGSSLVTASDAEAQTVGMERRAVRRQGRRTGRQVRRVGRRTARVVRRQARRY